MLRTSPISTEKAPAYATSSDFCRVFADDLENMHLLSFLLTADHTKADELLSPVSKIVTKRTACFETGRAPGLGGP
jgi:hypothetical protein